MYKRQGVRLGHDAAVEDLREHLAVAGGERRVDVGHDDVGRLLYTSDAADDLLRVDLGGCRIIKKKHNITDPNTPF